MIYDAVGPYMMIYDAVGPYMMIYDTVGPYMMIYDTVGPYMMIYDTVGPCHETLYTKPSFRNTSLLATLPVYLFIYAFANCRFGVSNDNKVVLIATRNNHI